MPNDNLKGDGIDLSIIIDIKNKIAEIKDKLKEQGISKTLFDELTANARLLQGLLDRLLNKVNLTQSDINDAYTTLQNVKRTELQKETKKSFVSASIIIGLIIASIFGINYLLKKK
jgi:hypothetical protein